jgi:Domain of unknown function (DUF4352)
MRPASTLVNGDLVNQPPHAPYPPQAQPVYGQDGQAPYGFPPPPAQAPRRPFYKKTWFALAAGLTGLAIVGSAVGGGTAVREIAAAAGEASADVLTGEGAEPADDASALLGIGQDAADGRFSFVVDGVDCRLTEIGDEYLGTTAQGKFCVVDLTITNTDDEPQSFFGENATLFNADGQKFSADSEAAIYLAEAQSLYEEINPGNSVASKIVFDVPADVTPTSIELHDSAFSGGVTVSLG